MKSSSLTDSPGCDADVATRVERPTLGFDFFERGDFAKAGHVAIFGFTLTPAFSRFRGRGREDFGQLRFGFVATEGEVEFFITVEADNIGEKSDLRFGPIAVSAIDLPVDMAGVDE